MKHVKITVEVSSKAYKLIQKAHATGFWGITEEDAIRWLLYAQFRQLKASDIK